MDLKFIHKLLCLPFRKAQNDLQFGMDGIIVYILHSNDFNLASYAGLAY